MNKSRILLFIFFSFLFFPLYAQMSDEQVVEYVKEQSAAGKGERQIGRELMARGVTREQAERIKARYEESQGAETAVSHVAPGVRERRSDASEELSAGSMDVVEDVVSTPTEQSDAQAAQLIFGHDVFNGKALTFEPNENLATPADYRLGPGDEVIINQIMRLRDGIQVTKAEPQKVETASATNAHTEAPAK